MPQANRWSLRWSEGAVASNSSTQAIGGGLRRERLTYGGATENQTVTQSRLNVCRNPRLHGIEAILIAGLVVLVVVGQWRVAVHDADRSVVSVRRPRGVMGTDCVLAAVTAERDTATAEAALDAAEAVLRQVEARMSSWLDDSEISRLRRAAAGVLVPLSPDTVAVLAAARQAFEDTDQAFDVTCRPQIELWQAAGAAAELPSDAAIAEARRASRWADLELAEGGVVKRSASAGVDLGGIAKGRGIDQALQVMRRMGMRGGLVDVGGDLACFGRQPGGHPWLVAIKDPAQPGTVAQLRVEDCAVATSGDYARYVEIAGQRYSHILDPRSGRPTQAARSATVIANTALAADVWATALSVLGAEGLPRVPEGIEALLICGGADDPRLVCTPAFRDRLIGGSLDAIPTTPSCPP